jgi:hypothetical protein
MTAPHCPGCNGFGRALGTLGRLRRYRCRACGVDFSHPKAMKMRPRSPRPALQSNRRIVNERAWRRVKVSAAVAALPAAADVRIGQIDQAESRGKAR